MPSLTHAPIIVEVVDTLIIGNRKAFQQRLARHLADGADVIVDLSLAKYIDTGGLGTLQTMQREFSQAGRQLVVCGLTEDLASLFTLTQLDRVFTLHHDVDAARAEIALLQG